MKETMTSKERFLATMNYTGYDRMAVTFHSTPEISRDLTAYLKLENPRELAAKFGTDFRGVGPSYIGPELRHFDDGTWEGLWGERYFNYSFGDGTYPEACFLPYKDITDPADLKKLKFPSADHFDYSTIKEQCLKQENYAVVFGGAGDPDFMNGIGRCRGVEQILLDIAYEDEVFLELCRIRFEFFYNRLKRTLEAADGLIDVCSFGEDLGNQNGLMISPASYDFFFAGYMEKLFKLSHDFGAKTRMHCCGSCFDLIPRLIEVGLDILEVVQVDAAKMGIRDLHENFYRKIVFNGSMSVQSLLPFGTLEDIRREVALRKELFADGGMILGPTHAIQVGTPLENIVEMYRSVGSLRE